MIFKQHTYLGILLLLNSTSWTHTPIIQAPHHHGATWQQNKPFSISHIQAAGLIDLGKTYAQCILNNDLAKVPVNSREDLLATLVALTWYFCAGPEGDSERASFFHEGAFLIPRDFFHLVERYLAFVQEAGYSIEGWYRGPNPFAYYRTSSHLAKLTNNRHIGIDICFDKKHGAQSFLPGRKRHLLFIDYGHKDFIYMKPENYGIYGIVDAFFHGTEFIIEKVGRVKPIRKLFGMKHDDHPVYNKEQIPVDIKNDYRKLLKSCGISQKSDYHHKTKLTIADMYSSAMELEKKFPHKAKVINEFVAKLKTRFTRLDARIGNEIIVSKTDILAVTAPADLAEYC